MSRKKRDAAEGPTPRGIIVIDKPLGLTSRRALDSVERKLEIGALGHCGSLDPLATGVLVLVVGKARKIQDLIMRSEKVYDITVVLGARSETDDAEGEIVVTEPTPEPVELERIEAELDAFRGEITQIPPIYSAIKVEGKRLHREARKGNKVEAPPREVTIHALEVTRFAWPEVDLRITCSSGTYARAIARDLGEALGTGAYMSRLVRERVGNLTLDDAVDPEEVEVEDLVGIEKALEEFPRLNVPLDQRHLLLRGQTLRTPPGFPIGDPCFAWVNGEVVSSVNFVNGGTHYRTKKLLT